MLWKISTNKTLFDWKDARKHFRINGEFILYQSKGKSTMKMIPKKGDGVIIICDKQEVLVGVVEYGFQKGTLHQIGKCKFSTGSNIGHREPEYYATIRITSLGDMSTNRGLQRTWTTYKKR